MIRANIHTPEFVSVKLYNDAYVLSISLHTSPRVRNLIESTDEVYPIEYKGKPYIHWHKCYEYRTSFEDSFREARLMLNEMMVLIRKAKICALEHEILSIRVSAE